MVLILCEIHDMGLLFRVRWRLLSAKLHRGIHRRQRRWFRLFFLRTLHQVWEICRAAFTLNRCTTRRCKNR